MKHARIQHTLVFVTALLLTAGMAWAGEPAGTATAEPALDATPLAESGCMLPELAGLSEDEIQAAALGAGLDVAPAQAAVPACPVRFDCSSITNCAAGSLCSATDLGPCCTSGGLQLCCITGTIKVRRCPCVCTAPACSFTCVNSDDVRWRCS